MQRIGLMQEKCAWPNSFFHTAFWMPSGNEEWWKVLRTTGKKGEVGVAGKLGE